MVTDGPIGWVGCRDELCPRVEDYLPGRVEEVGFFRG